MLQSLQLERLAMYHDSDSIPWKIDKGWEDLSPKEWVEVCSYIVVFLGCFFCFFFFFLLITFSRPKYHLLLLPLTYIYLF